MNKRIYLCLAHMSGNEMKYIQEAFDTNWVVPLGPNVNGFEQELKAFCGVEGKEVVALSAGTAAGRDGEALLFFAIHDLYRCDREVSAHEARHVRGIGVRNAVRWCILPLSARALSGTSRTGRLLRQTAV